MKNIVRFAAIALIATGAYVGNTHAATKSMSSAIAMKSAAPIPVCPPNTPDGCGIGNF
jgi:hypothetical protein